MHHDPRLVDMLREPPMKPHTKHQKYGKHKHLQPKPCHNNPIPDPRDLCMRRQPCASRLNIQTHQVSQHKNARRPPRRDGRETLTAHRAHDARIHHVERGGEEDGREEKEDGLEYEGADAGGREVREYAAEEADDFDYNGQLSCAAIGAK
jgi:hypothetical protein